MQELEEAERYSAAALFTLALHSTAAQAHESNPLHSECVVGCPCVPALLAQRFQNSLSTVGKPACASPVHIHLLGVPIGSLLPQQSKTGCCFLARFRIYRKCKYV